MTLDEAVNAILEETRDENWTIDDSDGWLRWWREELGKGEANRLCPLTALCLKRTGKAYWSGDYALAAEELGIAEKDAEIIADAADRRNTNEPDSPRAIVRQKLLTLTKKERDE